MDKCKILIIEDDSDLREGLSFSFSGDGYDVAEAGTKREVMISCFLTAICRTEQALNYAERFAATAIYR